MARLIFIFILFFIHEGVLFTLRFLWLFFFPQPEWTIRFFNFIYFDIASFLIFFLPLSMVIWLASERFLKRFSFPITFFLFFLPFYLFTFLNTADVIYYTTAQKRMTYELFSLTGDLLQYTGTIFRDYFFWFLGIFLTDVVVSYLIYRLLQRIKKMSLRYRIINVFLFLGISLFLVRGGFRYKPITPTKAYEGVSVFWGNWHLNTGYVLAHYILAEKEEKIRWHPEEEAVKISREYAFSPKTDKRFLSEEYPLFKETRIETSEKKYNIVLIILESFSVPYLDQGNTPFFDSLKHEGIYFENYYANAVRSIEAIPALFSGVPNLFDFSFIGSPYALNSTPDVGSFLQSEGYKTAFFHGARRGSMGFEEYLKAHGIEEYYGKEDFPDYKNPKYFDGTWGIYDNYFMEFFREKIVSFKEPFFASYFSLSNHHPFKLPDKNQGDYRATLRFTDSVLRRFFEKIRTWKGFENTIFLITADHYTRFGENYLNFPEQHQVPFLIYAPHLFSPGKITYPVSHINLLPTLIDILGLKTHYSSFVPSGLDSLAKHFALFRHSESLILVRDSGAVERLRHNKRFFLFRKTGLKNWKRTDSLPELKKPDELLELLSQAEHNLILSGKFFPNKRK